MYHIIDMLCKTAKYFEHTSAQFFTPICPFWTMNFFIFLSNYSNYLLIGKQKFFRLQNLLATIVGKPHQWYQHHGHQYVTKHILCSYPFKIFTKFRFFTSYLYVFQIQISDLGHSLKTV